MSPSSVDFPFLFSIRSLKPHVLLMRTGWFMISCCHDGVVLSHLLGSFFHEGASEQKPLQPVTQVTHRYTGMTGFLVAQGALLMHC